MPPPLVFDTNVLVAAGFRPGSASGRLVRAALAGRLPVVWDAATQAESAAVVGAIPPLAWADFDGLYRDADRCDTTGPPSHFSVVPDPADRKFAALAAAAGAVLVTQDHGLLDIRDALPVPVLMPREAAAAFLDGEVPTPDELAGHLTAALDAEGYATEGDPTGVWIASSHPVRRLGLRLEAGRPPYGWSEGLDAVVLHRPFGLWPARLPRGLGILAYHGALDDRLSVGYNPALAAALGLRLDAEPLHYKNRPIGMVGALSEPAGWGGVVETITGAFDGVDAAEPGGAEAVERVAVVGAMSDALVREAAERGTTVYVTGQLRKAARAAVAATGLGVVAVGQDRAEWWGLRALGRLVQSRWPVVEVVEV